MVSSMKNFAPIGPGVAEKTAPVESATDQDRLLRRRRRGRGRSVMLNVVVMVMIVVVDVVALMRATSIVMVPRRRDIRHFRCRSGRWRGSHRDRWWRWGRRWRRGRCAGAEQRDKASDK